MKMIPFVSAQTGRILWAANAHITLVAALNGNKTEISFVDGDSITVSGDITTVIKALGVDDE